MHAFIGLTSVKVLPCKEELTLIRCCTRFCCFKKKGKWECWALRYYQGINRWWLW